MPKQPEPSEHFTLLRQMEQLEETQRRILGVERANGRKLDLLLAKTIDAEQLATLTAQLASDDAELQASIDAAKTATPTTE